MPDWSFLITAGFLLIILGFFLVAFGIMRPAKEGAGLEGGQETRDVKVKGGGVILIGPVPIVFGTDKRYALLLMLLTIVLMLIVIIFLR